MNILIQTIVSPFQHKQKFGGAETSLRLIAEKLSEKGHTVIFVSNSNESSLLGLKKTQHKAITHYQFGIPFVPFSNRIRVKKRIKAFQQTQLKKIVQQQQIDIVHTYYNPTLCSFYLDLKSFLDYKLVVRVAGLKWYEDIKTDASYVPIYKRIFNESDALNFISQGLFEHIKAICKKERFPLHPAHYFIGDIGIETLHLDTIKKNKYHKEFTLIMATRFSSYQKRQDVLVQALAQLKGEFSFKLYFVGDGDNKTNIEAAIVSHGLSNHIEIIPFLKQTTLFQLIKSCDVLCHACDYEGLSKIIIETMYLKVPVLVSNVSPLNSYIIDGENGYLEVNDPTLWAEKIRFLYQHQERLSSIGASAHQFILEHYSASNNVNLYEEAFSQLM